MRILLTGSTGLLGTALRQRLIARGDTVVAHTRRAQPQAAQVHWLRGDAQDPATYAGVLDEVDAVINLAGAPIAQRWTRSARQQILHSRVGTTRALVAAARGAKKLPTRWLNASAVGYYGAHANAQCDESSPRGRGFLSDVTAAWEAETAPLAGFGVGVHLMRLGVVLAREGGVLPLLRGVTRSYLGGPLGDGQQWMSWVHLEDAVALFLWAMHGAAPPGPLNTCAPNAARQAEMMARLGQLLRRPSWLRAPALPMRWALGQMAEELLLGGQNVVPKVALSNGFVHAHPVLEGALRQLLGR